MDKKINIKPLSDKMFLVKSFATDNDFIISVEVKYNDILFKIGKCVDGYLLKTGSKSVPKYTTENHIYGNVYGTDVVFINNIYYYDDCTNNKKMPNGNNGTVDMINTLITFIYPHINYIKFKDSSNIPCVHKINNSIYQNYNDTVSLFYLYMARHGVSWYEEKFGAIFLADNYDILKRYYESKDRLISQSFKNSFMYDQLQLPTQYCNEEYKLLFEESKNFVEFVNKIYDKLNNRYEFCMFIRNWVYRFFLNKIFMNSLLTNGTYLIDLKSYSY